MIVIARLEYNLLRFCSPPLNHYTTRTPPWVFELFGLPSYTVYIYIYIYIYVCVCVCVCVGLITTFILSLINTWKIKQPCPNIFGNWKNKGLTPEIQWSVLKRSNTPSCFDGRCDLCLEEKIQILLYPDPG